MKLSNVRRLVAPITYMVLDIDDMIDVDTSSGGLTTLYIPNIVQNGYDQVPKKIYINDVSNNASVGKITVVCIGGNTINNLPQIVLESNGVSAEIEIADRTRYLANLNTDDSPTPSGSSEIKIPTPQLRIGKMNTDVGFPPLSAYYLPFSSGAEEFLSHNPKYYLFMDRSRKLSINKGVKIIKEKGFYHPTHQNGINFPSKAFYSGTTEYPLDTEYPLIAGGYSKSLLSFNPFQFARIFDKVSNSYIIPTVADYGTNLVLFKLQGKKGKSNKRVVNFKLAIGIDNPNTNSKTPILFGELSETFRINFSVRKIGSAPLRVGFEGFNIDIQTTGLRKKI